MKETKQIPFVLNLDMEGALEGFGAALIGDTDAPRNIVVNFNAILCLCVEDANFSWKEVTADTVLHEILHHIQNELGRACDEEEVNEAIEAARRLMALEYHNHAKTPRLPMEKP